MKSATRSNKTRANKTDYMSDDAFADLKEAVEDALAFERGERRNLHVTRIQAPGSPKDKMEAVEGISRGLESIERKAGKPANKFFQEFFADNSIPEHD